MELQAQSTPERNFSIINPLNFMRAEYNGAMGIPNNCQLFCEAHENGIPLGFSLPILSQILILSVYKGTLPLYMITYSLNFMRAKYNGAPTDGSSWESAGNSNVRVLRGGSWTDGSRGCRSARRRYYDADLIYDNEGFRVISFSPVVSGFRS